jgi:hypothetical protein
MPLESKTMRLATKYTPLILRFNLRHIVFQVHLFLGHQLPSKNNIGPPEYLRSYMVDTSSSIVLLDSAMAGFPWQVGARGH